VQFAPSSAQILSDSFALLDAIAEILLQHPELELVSVDGYTDAYLLELAGQVEGLGGPEFSAAVKSMKYRSFVTASEKAYEKAGGAKEPGGPGTPTAVINDKRIPMEYNGLLFNAAAFESLLQQRRELLGLLSNPLAQGGQVLLQIVQTIGEMQTGEYGYPRGIGIGSLGGDGRHQFIHTLGQEFHFAWIALGQERKRLTEDSDPDGLLCGFVGRVVHP